MDNQKEAEREEVHRTIWAVANELRGSVDGWDFKQYVLCTIFYRHISEDLCNYVNESERRRGNSTFDYALITNEEAESARENITSAKSYYIAPGDLFCNVRERAKDDKNLNITLHNIFNRIESQSRVVEIKSDDGAIEKSVPCMEGLFGDFDTSSAKLGATVAQKCDKLNKLLNAVANMKLGRPKDLSIDTYGDAYEYLMAMYASNAGKSGGEFYTPQEVSRLLALLTMAGRKDKVVRVYDPACGSGGLLLKFLKEAADSDRLKFFGQEINITTYNLCRMNMFLHDVDPVNFTIALGDTLTNPMFKSTEEKKKFDAVVSNPPYSIKWEGKANSLLINDDRYSSAGILAPQGKADLAFIMHSLYYLSNTGVAAIVCFPGVLYRGGAEAKIREYLLQENYIDAVIALPSNLFFGTSIATCIMVLKKCKTNDPNVLFIDATGEFIKVTNNNKLSDENIKNILGLFRERKDKKYLSKLVNINDIIKNDSNLSVSSYVEKEDKREVIDIKALNSEIKDVVKKEEELRRAIDKIIEELGGLEDRG